MQFGNFPLRSSHSSDPSQQSHIPSFIRLLGTERSRPRPVLCLPKNKEHHVSISLNQKNQNSEKYLFWNVQ